jgi:hypothetical protein
MAWVILRIVAEVAFSKAMQVGHPKTTEVYENAEACKVRGQVLAICSLSKTAHYKNRHHWCLKYM